MYSYAQCALQVSRPNGGHGTDPVDWSRTLSARTWTNGTCPTLEIACERPIQQPKIRLSTILNSIWRQLPQSHRPWHAETVLSCVTDGTCAYPFLVLRIASHRRRALTWITDLSSIPPGANRRQRPSQGLIRGFLNLDLSHQPRTSSIVDCALFSK